MRRVCVIFILCWVTLMMIMIVARQTTPDQEWNLTIRNGYWWREYEGQDDRIETLGKLERINAYEFGQVSIQTTAGYYSVRYDGRTGDIDGLFSASGEEITQHYTDVPNLPFHLLLHVAGAIAAVMSVHWFSYIRTRRYV